MKALQMALTGSIQCMYMCPAVPTPVVIDSLEAVLAAGKSYLLLYGVEGVGINKSSKDCAFQNNQVDGGRGEEIRLP